MKPHASCTAIECGSFRRHSTTALKSTDDYKDARRVKCCFHLARSPSFCNARHRWSISGEVYIELGSRCWSLKSGSRFFNGTQRMAASGNTTRQQSLGRNVILDILTRLWASYLRNQ